ncbi:hypothetical protein OTU49_008137 [Cherax quadricarinatus]|uniref:Uncharacterized protein n=1 Tax=Cherax quadricarinatus TaxID=27406 RepID=A0AAW0WS17_CHEQU
MVWLSKKAVAITACVAFLCLISTLILCLTGESKLAVFTGITALLVSAASGIIACVLNPTEAHVEEVNQGSESQVELQVIVHQREWTRDGGNRHNASTSMSDLEAPPPYPAASSSSPHPTETDIITIITQQSYRGTQHNEYSNPIFRQHGHGGNALNALRGGGVESEDGLPSYEAALATRPPPSTHPTHHHHPPHPPLITPSPNL